MMDDSEMEGGSPGEADRHKSSDDHCMIRLKKFNLPIVKPLKCGHPVTSYRKVMKMCELQTRDAILHQRWQEAAHYMTAYPQMLEDLGRRNTPQEQETVWRFGIEILHHHPKTRVEDYHNIYERIKNTSYKKYLMICLEHSFHMLVTGQVLEAKNQLSVAEGWRHGMISQKQAKTAKLISAYRSLLDYFMWCDRRHSYNSGQADELPSEEMHSYFRQASATMKKFLRDPGVWDPFIVSYVEMLEFYEDHEQALTVLKNYAYDDSFPPNPNALVYLYEFQRRHGTPERKILKVLKMLHAAVPSHELMLEYGRLLLQSEKHSDIQKALEVVLGMLDFDCWRRHLDLWKHLKAIIEKLQQEQDWKGVVQKEMAQRKDWWPALHFTRFHARKDSEENPELMEVKASLTKILCPDLKLSYAAAQRAGST